MNKTCGKCKLILKLDYFYKCTKTSYRSICISCERLISKKWRQQNKEKVNKYMRIYRKKYNIQLYDSSYQKNRYKNDTNYRLAKILRNRLNAAIRNNIKVGSAVKDLGCTIEKFKLYIESRFLIGMTWANYGKEWHIDHIIPLSSFNLTDKNQLVKACHYTNLQPLWALDNLSKHSKII